MAKPRYEVRRAGTRRVIAWFDDIFYAYQFVEAIFANTENEYVITDTAEKL